MVNSLATDTRDILWITNLLNNSPMYTIDKGGDCQTLRKMKISNPTSRIQSKTIEIELTYTSISIIYT